MRFFPYYVHSYMIDGIWELRQRLPNVVMVEVLVTTICPYYIDQQSLAHFVGLMCSWYMPWFQCVYRCQLYVAHLVQRANKHLLFIYSETMAYTHPVACTYTMYINIQNGFVNVWLYFRRLINSLGMKYACIETVISWSYTPVQSHKES